MDTDLSLMRQVMVNSTQRLSFGRDALLSDPRCWMDLDYGRILAADVRRDLEWTLEEGGAVHGIGLWFEAELDEGVGFSTGPDAPKTIYGRLVLPLAEPLILAPGDRLAVRIEARLLGDEYLWRWDTQVWGRDEDAPAKARLTQSTFHAQVFSAEQLRLQADDFAPSLDVEGQWTRLALSLMDGHHRLGDIAAQVTETFPNLFPQLDDALAAVKALARQFGGCR
jgi:protein arginine N-methyltransferase 1